MKKGDGAMETVRLSDPSMAESCNASIVRVAVALPAAKVTKGIDGMAKSCPAVAPPFV